MSLGVGAFADLVNEDDAMVRYKYGGFNLNDDKYGNEQKIADGYITIQKRCFKEPEIHEKLKRTSSGKKKLVMKRVHVDVDYGGLFEEGSIQIENCSNCWNVNPDGVDMMAFKLLRKIFDEYQNESKIPASIFIFS